MSITTGLRGKLLGRKRLCWWPVASFFGLLFLVSSWGYMVNPATATVIVSTIVGTIIGSLTIFPDHAKQVGLIWSNGIEKETHMVITIIAILGAILFLAVNYIGGWRLKFYNVKQQNGQ